MDTNPSPRIIKHISSVEDFIKYIRDDWQDIRLYRGQSEDWLLLPKLGRLKLRNEVVTSESEMLERFKEQSVPFLQVI
jgi:hypothetical protein